MKKFVIIGSGDHANVIANELILKKQFQGFIDLNISKVPTQLKKYYLGNMNILKNKKYKNLPIIIGVGRGDLRKKIVKELKIKKIKINWGKYISSDAKIMPNVIIDEGSVVLKGCIINNDTKIGKHCHFNTGAFIDHGNIFKNYSSVGPGVKTGGNVIVGNESFIGLGSLIKNNITITSKVIIGIGSVVVKNIKKTGIYFGAPAKFKRLKKVDEKYLN